MPDADSGIWELVKSVLLPVDTHAVHTALNSIHEDAQKTSWLQLFYRLEGISMLILISGATILFTVFAYEHGIGVAEIQAVGVQYTLGFAVLAVFTLAKGFVWMVQRVNTGKSVWGESENINLKFFLRGAASIVLVLIPIYVLSIIEVPVGTIVVFFIVSCMVLGSLIAGISGVLSIVLLLKS